MNIRHPLAAACIVAVTIGGGLQAQAQSSSYSNYLRQTEAIERNATASTNRALRTISQGIARDQQASNAILRQYIQQNYRRLQQQYYTSGASRSMRFEQFANQELLSHATIRPDTSAFAAGQAAHQAQVDRFNGMQAAAKTRSDAGESLIHNMQKNSDSQLATIERSDQGSIRGNTAYINPSSGNAQWMPTNAPGAHQATDGTNYYQDRDGRYYQQQGSSWVSMQPAGR
jgi:hypothetical protein